MDAMTTIDVPPLPLEEDEDGLAAGLIGGRVQLPASPSSPSRVEAMAAEANLDYSNLVEVHHFGSSLQITAAGDSSEVTVSPLFSPAAANGKGAGSKSPTYSASDELMDWAMVSVDDGFAMQDAAAAHHPSTVGPLLSAAASAAVSTDRALVSEQPASTAAPTPLPHPSAAVPSPAMAVHATVVSEQPAAAAAPAPSRSSWSSAADMSEPWATRSPVDGSAQVEPIDCTTNGGGAEVTPEREYSIFALFRLRQKIYEYEPNLGEFIDAIVRTRQPTPSEIATNAAITHLEAGGRHYHLRLTNKVNRDQYMARGYGPRPSHAEKGLAMVVGSSCAHCCARKAIDPCVRCCLCERHNKYGRPERLQCSSWKVVAIKAAAIIACLIDVADVAVDISLTHKLVSDGRTGYAALLGCAVAIAIPLEVILKALLLSNLEDEPLADSSINREDFILLCAFTELAVFLVEDATSVFCWYNTDVFDPDSDYSKANLYLTFVSGLMASGGSLLLIIICVIVEESDGDCCSEDCAYRCARNCQNCCGRRSDCRCTWTCFKDVMSAVYVLFVFCAVQLLLVWWSYIAFDVILPGNQSEQSKEMDDTVLALYIVGTFVTVTGLMLFFYTMHTDDKDHGTDHLKVLKPSWWYGMICGGGCRTACCECV